MEAGGARIFVQQHMQVQTCALVGPSWPQIFTRANDSDSGGRRARTFVLRPAVERGVEEGALGVAGELQRRVVAHGQKHHASVALQARI